MDVYFIGASGIQPSLGRTGISLGGLECRTDNSFEVGEKETEIEHNSAPRTTDEQALLSWQLMQRVRKR